MSKYEELIEALDDHFVSNIKYHKAKIRRYKDSPYTKYLQSLIDGSNACIATNIQNLEFLNYLAEQLTD